MSWIWPECGYWLRRLTDKIERCPECGTIRAAVTRAETE